MSSHTAEIKAAEMQANEKTAIHHRTMDQSLPYPTVPVGSGVKLAMQQIFRHLREGRNIGPMSVLVLVVIYSLLSPHLPAPIHDYIYHIAH